MEREMEAEQRRRQHTQQIDRSSIECPLIKTKDATARPGTQIVFPGLKNEVTGKTPRRTPLIKHDLI